MGGSKSLFRPDIPTPADPLAPGRAGTARQHVLSEQRDEPPQAHTNPFRLPAKETSSRCTAWTGSKGLPMPTTGVNGPQAKNTLVSSVYTSKVHQPRWHTLKTPKLRLLGSVGSVKSLCVETTPEQADWPHPMLMMQPLPAALQPAMLMMQSEPASSSSPPTSSDTQPAQMMIMMQAPEPQPAQLPPTSRP